MTLDERGGLPSASSFERVAACPGSFWWSKQSPAPEDTKDAASGTRIHAYLAGEITADKLSEEEMHTATACDSLAWEFLKSRGFTPDSPIKREQRFWMIPDYKPLCSGKADLFARKGPFGVVIDYKTGRNEVTTATGNLQLRALVACVAADDFLGSVEAVIVQPWASPRVTVAYYGPKEIELATAEIVRIARSAIEDEGKTTVAGDHCKYCPAKGLCPATRVAVQTLAVTVADRSQRELMSPAEKLQFWKACNLAIEIAESFKAHVKRELENDPRSIPGLTLKPGAVRTKVTDVSELYSRMWTRFATSAQVFASACSITKTDLKSLVKEQTGKKGAELDAVLGELVNGIVEEKQTAPSVEEVKS